VSWLRRALLFVVAIYLLLCAVMYLLQRRMQYFPDGGSVSAPAGAEDVTLKTADGLSIKATYWVPKRDTTLLIFHGNAGHRGDRFGWVSGFVQDGWGVLLIDYRGYGGSEGSPTEQGLYKDADAAAAFLAQRGAKRVVYFGRSLGAGVAVDLAARRAPAGLIVECGALAIVDVAKEAYPAFPVGWLMRDRYDGRGKVEKIACPGLFIHGARDTLIPPRMGRALFDAYGAKKEWYEVEGAGHNDVSLVGGRAYYRRISDWLEHAR